MKNLVVSKKDKAILVLDIGTSFVKIGLFDTSANPIKDYQIKFEHWMTIKSDGCLLYTSPSPRDATLSRMPSSA